MRKIKGGTNASKTLAVSTWLEEKNVTRHIYEVRAEDIAL